MVSRALAGLGLISALTCALASCDRASEGPTNSTKKAETLPDDVDIRSAKADADTWMEFSSKEDRFEARFPVAPKKQTLETPNPLGGTIPAAMYMAEQADRVLGITVLSIPAEHIDQYDATAGLDGARDGMINNIGGTIVSEKQIDFVGHPARAVVAKASTNGHEMHIEARLFFVSPRMYQLLVVTEQPDPANTEKFFSSFALAEG